MRFRAKIVPLLLAVAPVAGCDNTDAGKAVAKTTTPDKADAKGDPKVDAKTEGKTEPKQEPKVPLVIERPEDIPVALGGAPVPWQPPPPPPTKADPKAPSAPAPASAPASGAAGAAAPAPAAAPTKPTAIAVTHDHAPGEACRPLTREEVEKALADLKK